MTKRQDRGALLLAGCCAALLACGPGSRAPSTPNLMIIVIDTLRPDHLGDFGYGAQTSPELDALSGESIVFEHAQSVSPWTAPALISLMTSLYPDVHGVYRFPRPGRMNDDVTTLAEVLQARAYATAAFTEGGYAKGDFGLEQGFDVYPKNPGDATSNDSNLQYPSRLEANVERALHWLRSRDEQPFFLFFHTYEVHFPYRAPEPDIRRFSAGYSSKAEGAALSKIATAWNRGERLSEAAWERLVIHYLHCQLADLPAVKNRAGLWGAVLERIEAAEAGRAPLAPETLDFIRALYDAEIRYTSRHISRLWSELRTQDLERNTLLMVVSDHGEGLGQHDSIQHGVNLHDELTRVMLMLRVPGVEPRRVDALVRTIDAMPSLLELMGISSEALSLQGKSIMPLLSGGDDERIAYLSARAIPGSELQQHAVRSRRWLYVEDARSGERWLYDRKVDPGELANVAELVPDVAAKLATQLADLRTANAEAAAGLSASQEALSPETRERLRSLGYLE